MAALKEFVDGRMIKHMDYFTGDDGNQLERIHLTFIKKGS